MWQQFIPPILIKLFERWFKNISKDDDFHKNERRKLANMIRDVITEAESKVYSDKPDDFRHIIHILNQAKLIDTKIEELFGRYIGQWLVYESIINQKANIVQEEENRKFLTEQQDDLNELKNELFLIIQQLKK